jgi:hypothetical protein
MQRSEESEMSLSLNHLFDAAAHQPAQRRRRRAQQKRSVVMTVFATTPGSRCAELVAGHAYTIPVVRELPRPALTACDGW